MKVTSQKVKSSEPVGRAKQRARTRKLILDAALTLIRQGVVPTVEQAAAAADVSAATGYRYFPTQGALVHNALDSTFAIYEAPVQGDDVAARVETVVGNGVPILAEYEAAHRAELRLAIDQWIALSAGQDLREPPIERGGRRGGIAKIVAPLAGKLDKKTRTRLEASLGIVMGIEAWIVARDIFHLDPEETRDVFLWACKAFVRTAIDDAKPPRKPSGKRRT